MNGFLNINKPKDCTSHDVVAKIRRSLNIKRVGHSGTLDPFATGVIIIGINYATKLFEYLNSDKTYIGEIQFGYSTDTDDITGKILDESTSIPSSLSIEKVLKEQFTGEIKQRPPIYSAINIKGQRAYKLARKNKISLESLKERGSTIFSNKIMSFEKNILKLEIHCSSGTYIRSIARDLGEALNSKATLCSLNRIKVGEFNIKDSIDVEHITPQTLAAHVIPPKNHLSLPEITLDKDQIEEIKFGRSIAFKCNANKGKICQLINEFNEIIAIGIQSEDGLISPQKVFIKNESSSN